MGQATTIRSTGGADPPDAAASRLLQDSGWVEPDAEVLPTGAQVAVDYLQPLADLPALKPHVRYGAQSSAPPTWPAARRSCPAR
nr:hypothetical protein GCM10020063_010160 [Dactylosporangium thailandense]